MVDQSIPEASPESANEEADDVVDTLDINISPFYSLCLLIRHIFQLFTPAGLPRLLGRRTRAVRDFHRFFKTAD
jgi:hypothetical protein